jgi:hypothetical protein
VVNGEPQGTLRKYKAATQTRGSLRDVSHRLLGLVLLIAGAEAMVVLVGMTLFLWALLVLLPLVHRWTGLTLLALFDACQVVTVA